MIEATHVVVAVPVHNEEETLPTALAALDRARAEVQRRLVGVEVVLSLALDSCTDASARVELPRQTRVTTVDHGCVGATRAAAVRSGLLATPADASTLVLNTDADSEVPDDWIVDHLQAARYGWATVGRVEPRREELAPELRRSWRDRNPLDRVGVHGANLAVRAHVYREVGGFRPLPYDEDVDLFRRVRDAGVPWVVATRVITSARRVGRAPHGFASYLDRLHDELDGAPA